MKKISLTAAIASLALIMSTTASAGGGYDRHHGGHRNHHGNNTSFYIGFGPHGHVSYGLHVGSPRVYVHPRQHWRPVHQPRYNHRPYRPHHRVIHRHRGYCELHRGWHR